MRPITHIIYDMDGLLLNTEIFYTQVTKEIAARYGKEYTWEMKARILGTERMASAKLLIDMLELPLTPEELLEEKESRLASLFPSTEPMPGAKDITQHFFEQNIPQALATSSCKALYELKTTQHKTWFQYFHPIITGDDIENAKPAPDIFLAVAEQLDTDPEHCLVFEDAPSGVSAAKAANMSVIAIPDPHIDKNLFTNADLIINSLFEFKPADWNLPSRRK